jgi:cell division protease FtsH
MSTGEITPVGEAPPTPSEQAILANEWRRLGRAAGIVAALTSPMLFIALRIGGWSIIASLLVTIVGVAAFRGLVDVIAHRLIPRPSLDGAGPQELADDAVARRRVWFWRSRYLKTLPWLLVIAGAVFLLGLLLTSLLGYDSISSMWSGIQSALRQDPLVAVSTLLSIGILPLFFLANILILFGPLLVSNLRQMKGYEPGDANWGVRLSDVRGQKEPKEEVTRVISLWQSGEAFRKAGGRPERGLLFIGAPGTGKTMLSKAIATSFNSPIVTMPGSGFAATFIGIDVIVVMMLIRKARKLARKWGGQCIIFIDEIDAVGLRRQALGQGMGFMPLNHGVDSIHDLCFYGPQGALNPSGDLVSETEQWRERLFRARAAPSTPRIPAFYGWLEGRLNNAMIPGMFGGGQMALNQLLVNMDGITEPPMMRKFFSKAINNLLDASYMVPRAVGKRSLRMPAPKPRSEQIYFIGATNVPIDRLDPALLRPGRMGRHIWFRTPNKEDRKDILDLYLAKVDHDPDLDAERRRDELARIMNGYSPAMIEQVCSMALVLAHSDSRQVFEWSDFVKAMATIESGTMEGVEYDPEFARATAIHEAGHAAASHVYMHGVLSTRLSIRKRGGSLGHHQIAQLQEKFGIDWRHQEVGHIVWGLGSLAAEHVFYGENSTGVGGDLHTATIQASTMVGFSGMGPEPIDLNGRIFATEEERAHEEERYMKRFERIGTQLMNRSFGQVEQGDPIASILRDSAKQHAAARILGQAYVTAFCMIRHNRQKILQIAEVLVQRREMYGDEVVDLLDSVKLEAPAIDITDETNWPRL